MSALEDRRIRPSDVSPEILRQMAEALREDARALRVVHDGASLELPPALNDLLAYVVDAMEQKRTLLLLSEDEVLTTQDAADLLGMSRPYLLRLLEAGKIPFHRVGTHRRIVLRDLLAFRTERDRERRKRLDDLSAAIDGAGLYDRI